LKAIISSAIEVYKSVT